ncbi:MAG TPA: PASTA domain-containing protein [Acidimicrobiales bacterium]|nr:PASTA domain-containing protein [Acidimicrobiales bacterium]
MATPRIADSVGRVLGDRYRLTRPLGIGASAHVYVAEDVSLGRRVAIKVLHPALAGDEGFLRRFRAEAQVVASLRHPNILTVFDWGEDGGSPYLVMELLEGGSLRALLDQRVLLTPEQAAAIGSDAARALDYAHRRGLVHRDIKPANLIFDDEGRVTVADFGLARALAEATWTEPAGAVVGTARYAAPEQVRGEKLDSRADVYALALVLVEATTGTVPFATDTTLGTLMGRVERPLSVPPAAGVLGPVLEAAGTVDPADRLDAAAFGHALDRLAARLPVPAPLPLPGSLAAGRVERDPISPTEFPGRPKLFDVELADSETGGAGAWSGAGPATAVRSAGGSGGWADSGAPAPAAPPGPAVAGPGLAEGGDASPRPAAGASSPPEEAGAGGPDGRPRRRRLKAAAWIVGAVVLIAAAAGVAVEATRVLVPSHPVPRLIGDTEPQARAALDPLQLKLRVGQTRYSASQSGTVISQLPAAGKLKQGQTVTVVLSRGPQPVAVPQNLANLTESEAATVLETLGLKVGSVQHRSSLTVPAGSVISSSPDQGTLLPGQSVSLVVSTGKPIVAVPALSPASSASFAAAQAALAAVGLTAVPVSQFSSTVPKGQVIATVPPAGSAVRVGSSVTVEVSKGPQMVAVPNVTQDSVSEATATLEAAGFSVSGVTGNPTATVTGTSPPEGTLLVIHSSVQIITA